MVRNLTQRLLQMEGYTLLAVSGGREALTLLAQHNGSIDPLLTDVVMPGMSGRELMERARALRPGIKALLMSGYPDDAIIRHGILMTEVEFLAKPFPPKRLAAKARQVLDK